MSSTGQAMQPESAPQRGPAVLIDASAVWLLVGLILVAVLFWVLVTHALGTMLLLFVAIIFGEGIRPLVDLLEQHHVPRPVGVLAIYVMLVAVVFGLLWLLLQPLSRQVLDLLTNVPNYARRTEGTFQQIQQIVSQSPEAQRAIEALPAEISGFAGGVTVTLLGAPLLVVDGIFKFIELYLMAFFWLTATQPLKRFVLGVFPLSLRSTASDVIAELGHEVGGYTRGVAINMVVIACLSGAGLFILGIPYPLLLAFVAGLAETLPLLGPWLAGAFAAGVTLFTGGVVQAAEVVGLYLLIHLIEGNTLVPYVMYRITSLNPLATIVAISAGGAVLGLVGAVLGVPMVLVLQVLVLRVAAPALRHLAGVVSRDELCHPPVH